MSLLANVLAFLYDITLLAYTLDGFLATAEISFALHS